VGWAAWWPATLHASYACLFHCIACPGDSLSDALLLEFSTCLPSPACSPDLTCPPPPACLQSPETAEVLEALRGCETEARRKHRGMWMYGDPGSGDEDERDDGGFPSLGGKPAGGRGAGRR
jgi:hypothetical protein